MCINYQRERDRGSRETYIPIYIQGLYPYKAQCTPRSECGVLQPRDMKVINDFLRHPHAALSFSLLTRSGAAWRSTLYSLSLSFIRFDSFAFSRQLSALFNGHTVSLFVQLIYQLPFLFFRFFNQKLFFFVFISWSATFIYLFISY